MFTDQTDQYFNKNKPRILFFVDGMVPSELDKAEAATLGKVAFRNAHRINSEDQPEACDYVAGLVPPNYSHIPLAPRIDAPERAVSGASNPAAQPVPAPKTARGSAPKVTAPNAHTAKRDGWGAK